MDLRMHGDSQGFAGPHTIAAAARDLLELVDLAHPVGPLPGTRPGQVADILGHSFGGKVALEYVRQRQGDLDTAWIIDSAPGPRPAARGSEGVLHVLSALRRLPEIQKSRDAFVGSLVAEGFGKPLAQWLAMNLRPISANERDGEKGLRFQLDLDAMEALLADYFRTDLWDVVEQPPGRVRLHLVIGGRSDIFDQAELQRARRAEEASGGRVRVHVLPAAGHFVHVDDPDSLLKLLVADLP
jgi:pimeloyl-ACP methyl ester carboxylesterase